MKITYIKKNKLSITFILINLLCIFIIILVYSNFFGKIFFKINEKLESLLIVFSSGFILSSLFYCVVNYLPDNRKRKITQSIIQEKLECIGKNLQFIIEFVLANNNLKINNIKNISPPKSQFVKFKRTLQIEKLKDSEFEEENENEKKLLNDKRIKVISDCDYILNLPFINTIDFSIIKLIASIRNSDYLKEIDMNTDEVLLIGKHDEHFKLLISYFNELLFFVNLKKLSIKIIP